MNNFWLQIGSPVPVLQGYKNWSREFREAVLAGGILIKRKFRWLATCYGPGGSHQALVRIDRRPVDEGLGPITMTFYEEPAQKEFNLVVISLHDGIGCPLERWIISTQIKKVTYTPEVETEIPYCATWAYELDTQLLRYEHLLDPLSNYSERYQQYHEEIRVYHEEAHRHQSGKA